jgi:hypothetical protein
MSTMSHRRILATAATGALLAFPAASPAHPPTDGTSMYPGSTAGHKDYSMNSVNGEYSEPIHTQIGPAAPAQVTSPAPDGFAWGDAAAGAGIALLICGGIGLGGRVVVRRHRGVAGAPS